MALITNVISDPNFAVFEGGNDNSAATNSLYFPIAQRLISSNGFQRNSSTEVLIENGGVYQVKLSLHVTCTTNTTIFLDYEINGVFTQFHSGNTESNLLSQYFFLTIPISSAALFRVRARSNSSVITRAKCSVGGVFTGGGQVQYIVNDTVSFRRL